VIGVTWARAAPVSSATAVAPSSIRNIVITPEPRRPMCQIFAMRATL
jgi:hypothetical protein